MYCVHNCYSCFYTGKIQYPILIRVSCVHNTFILKGEDDGNAEFYHRG